MRWQSKIEPKYFPGDYRIISSFLWLPRTIKGETRWLEKVKIKQQLLTLIVVIWADREWIDIK